MNNPPALTPLHAANKLAPQSDTRVGELVSGAINVTTSQLMLRIRGFSDPQAVADGVDSSLIDVAYVEAISSEEILLSVDVGISIADDEDFTWLVGLLESCLRDVGQPGVIDRINVDLPNER